MRQSSRPRAQTEQVMRSGREGNGAKKALGTRNATQNKVGVAECREGNVHAGR